MTNYRISPTFHALLLKQFFLLKTRWPGLNCRKHWISRQVPHNLSWHYSTPGNGGIKCTISRPSSNSPTLISFQTQVQVKFHGWFCFGSSNHWIEPLSGSIPSTRNITPLHLQRAPSDECTSSTPNNCLFSDYIKYMQIFWEHEVLPTNLVCVSSEPLFLWLPFFCLNHALIMTLWNCPFCSGFMELCLTIACLWLQSAHEDPHF